MLLSESNVRRHEIEVHDREYYANKIKKAEPDLSSFRKCKVCGIYTSVHESEFISHRQSEHHKRAFAAVPSVSVNISSSNVPATGKETTAAIPLNHVPKLYGWRAAAAAAAAREALKTASVCEDAEDGNSYSEEESAAAYEDESAERASERASDDSSEGRESLNLDENGFECFYEQDSGSFN